MSLNPCSYILTGDAENEIHYGFVAQEVEHSFKSNGVDLNNHSIISIPETNDGRYSLGYSEFIPFNTYMTQKAHHRIDSLESENQFLKNEILMLQGQLSLITQRLQKMEEKLC